jgi:hypothetical protein
MRFCKLRIACSVTCATVVVSLWIAGRSLPQPILDTLPSIRTGQQSVYRLTLQRNSALIMLRFPPEWRGDFRSLRTIDLLGFNLQGTGADLLVTIPLWFMIVIATLVGHWLPATWSKIRRVRLRFSLRTLIIVTTLVAVLLGLIVWLSNR